MDIDRRNLHATLLDSSYGLTNLTLGWRSIFID